MPNGLWWRRWVRPCSSEDAHAPFPGASTGGVDADIPRLPSTWLGIGRLNKGAALMGRGRVVHPITVSVPGLDEPLCFEPSEDNAFWLQFSNGAWEPETISLLVRLLGPGSRFVDVGAWLGPITLIAASRGASVVAFEPDPVALSQLAANLDLNPGVRDRVKVVRAALSARDGHARLSSKRLGDSMSSLVRDDASATLVRTVDTASWSATDEFATADVVKIDTEGGEFVIVPRLRRAFRSHRPVLLLSVHAYPVVERFARHRTPLARAAALVVSVWHRLRLLASTRRYRYRWLWDKHEQRWRRLTAADMRRFLFSLRDEELVLADSDVMAR